MLLTPYHPRFVHFPIALLIVGVVLSLLHDRWPTGINGKFGTVSLDYLGLWALALGWLSMLPAVVSGLVDQSQIALDSPARTLANNHITAVVATWVLFGLALYERVRPRGRANRGLYVILLLAGTVALVAAGELGGQLVYSFGVGVR